jgi:hypothetical protein
MSVTLSQALAARYYEILANSKISNIYQMSPELDGLFLPSVQDDYESSSVRVMLVGKETRGWRQHQCGFRGREPVSEAAIAEAMATHRRYLAKPSGRVKLLQFHRRIAERAADNKPEKSLPVVWANLFCASYKKKTPLPAKAFGLLSDLSSELLRAQVDLLDPDIIFFATGKKYDPFLNNVFPASERKEEWRGKGNVLRGFQLRRARCFRTSHPQCETHRFWSDAALWLAFGPTSGWSR